MSATREEKEAWEAQYKLTEAEKRLSETIELVNESMIHYEHVRNNTMTQACDVLEGLFTPLAEEFGAARRKALEEAA